MTRPDGWPTNPNEVQKLVMSMRPPLTPEQAKNPNIRAYYELGYFIVPDAIVSNPEADVAPTDQEGKVAKMARLPEDTKLEAEVVEDIKQVPLPPTREETVEDYYRFCTLSILARKEAVAAARTMPRDLFKKVFREWTLENTAGKDYARAAQLNRVDPPDPNHPVAVMRLPRSCIDLNWRYMHRYLQRGESLAHLSWHERFMYEDALVELLERGLRHERS